MDNENINRKDELVRHFQKKINSRHNVEKYYNLDECRIIVDSLTHSMIDLILDNGLALEGLGKWTHKQTVPRNCFNPRDCTHIKSDGKKTIKYTRPQKWFDLENAQSKRFNKK